MSTNFSLFLDHLYQDEGTPVSNHRLALTMLIKIVKSLGCAYGCGEGHRGLSGDRLRHQVFRENVRELKQIPFPLPLPSLQLRNESFDNEGQCLLKYIIFHRAINALLEWEMDHKISQEI